MNARDASGRKVSLLNDDTTSQQYYAVPHRLSYRTASYVTSQPFHPSLTRSVSSSPHTPELLRSDSYDSHASNEPLSPMTPSVVYSEYGHNTAYASDTRSPYDDYVADPHATTGSKRSSSYGDNREVYEEDAATNPSAQNPPRRYPCRYRETHGCDKTFTTSGHASRHSKIHTAEKAVHCSFSGCSKKFTRADNMKQHLETHLKDKSRSSMSRPSGSRRTSSSGRSSAGSKRSDTTPLPSPGISSGAWDTRPLNAALHSRPTAARTPSGLDTLAMAVACQQGDA